MSTDGRPIIVYSPFNQSWGGRAFTPEWIAGRVGLYLRYTVPSLLRQTVAARAIWLDCRPGSQEELAPHLGGLTAAGVTATFDRGAALLAGLPAEIECFYLLRVDSDDLYGPDAIECVAELQGTARCSQFYSGYVYDLAKQRLSRIALPSPPFFSIRSGPGEIRSASDVSVLLRADGGRRGHKVVRELLDPVPLPDGRFCILRHSQNCGADFRGTRVADQQALVEVCERFGLPTSNSRGAIAG